MKPSWDFFFTTLTGSSCLHSVGGRRKRLSILHPSATPLTLQEDFAVCVQSSPVPKHQTSWSIALSVMAAQKACCCQPFWSCHHKWPEAPCTLQWPTQATVQHTSFLVYSHLCFKNNKGKWLWLCARKCVWAHVMMCAHYNKNVIAGVGYRWIAEKWGRLGIGGGRS